LEAERGNEQFSENEKFWKKRQQESLDFEDMNLEETGPGKKQVDEPPVDTEEATVVQTFLNGSSYCWQRIKAIVTSWKRG
jgi:hypothetical protein